MRDPRHILITGASSGIGAALAFNYAAPGILLSLHGRNAERLEKIAVQARRRGAEVATRIGDVTEAQGMASWVEERDGVQKIDLVIANAGVSAASADADEMAGQTQHVFAVNVEGVFNTVHPALALMRKRGEGQIALVSSLAGFRGFAGAAAYAASKAAVRVYGEALRAEMEPHGIEINVICPGFIKTPMTDANGFKMPFLMSAARAARFVRKGLENDRARIAFPWQMYVLIRMITALPQAVLDILVRFLPRK